MSKVVRVQGSDYRIVVGSQGNPGTIYLDTSPSPQGKVVVNGARLQLDSSSDTTLRINSSNNTIFRGVGIGAAAGDTTDYASLKLNAQTGELRIFVGPIEYGGFLTFYTAGSERTRIDTSGNLIQSAPTTPPSLATNRTMVFNLTSDTNLRVSVRGSDGVTRTANITLA
jgi:hypothetical protein